MARGSDYTALKAFLAATWRLAFEGAHVPPGLDPISVLERVEKSHPRQARAGLKETVNDVLAILSDWDPARLEGLDAILARDGVMRASDALARHSTRLRRLIDRGVIRNEADYRLLQGVLDRSEGGWSDEDRTRVIALLNAYEASRAAS